MATARRFGGRARRRLPPHRSLENKMDPTDFFPTEDLWQEDSLGFIKPEEYDSLGIDPADIPLGTYTALKHPPQLQSRFGGNAYGFGLFEVYDRLRPKDIQLLQSITLDDPEDIRKHDKQLNKIYKDIGLLIRFSSLGKPYYLIPEHLVSNTLTHIRSKVEEITKIVKFHRKKYLKEYHDIGLVSRQDDLIFHELSLRFKEHSFVVLDSLDAVKKMNQTLDLVILTRDLYETILTEGFGPLSREIPSRSSLNQYAIYILWKLYNLLKPDGEIFVIADHHAPRTNRTTTLIFKTVQEEKNFALFTHIFKTKRRYKIENHSVQVNIFDFQQYLSGLYVEQEIVQRLLAGKRLEEMTLGQIDSLPNMDFVLTDWPSPKDQVKNWSRLFSVFFDSIFLKPLIPLFVKQGWEKRFTFTDYAPDYMLIHLVQKKLLRTTLSKVKGDVMESRLAGCPTDLLADHRDSFEYVIRTLRVLDKLKRGDYKGLPHIFLDRLKQPLESKDRRFNSLNHIMRLLTKTVRLEKIRQYLNPDNIDGAETKALKNLEILNFFGFSHDELIEIFLIILGHSHLGRILSGKMNEKAMRPLSDLSRIYDRQKALNLLRYCRLMTMAETEAARGSELTQEQLALLFDIYESTVRVVTNIELDWDGLLDEKVSSIGGTHNKIVRKLLMMMNYFEFLDNWPELSKKGRMEKESLADYDAGKLFRIENVINLVKAIEQFEDMYLKFDPLQLPAFYRKFLDMEFYGTGHLFERMDSRHVFLLLWITVNLAQGDIINFNPILAEVESSEIEDRVEKVEEASKEININYLDLAILRRFSKQLYRDGSSFIAGTGFQLRVDPKTQRLEISYMDIDKSISLLETLSKGMTGRPISEIQIDNLAKIEVLFAGLDSFYQGTRQLQRQTDSHLKLPVRQKEWFKRIKDLRHYLRSHSLEAVFRPEAAYTEVCRLYSHAPCLLGFILPEFMALEDLDLSWRLYLRSPVTHYILSSLKKFQALVKHDKEGFQDTRFLHQLARREFGPMATGIVGVSESQVKDLEDIVDHLSHNRPLFDALVKLFFLQDLGRVPILREKYRDEINPTDLAHAAEVFLHKEEIAERYRLDQEGKGHLVFLLKHHDIMHHFFRGELSYYALDSILTTIDKDLFDAFFIFSFILLCAIREDLVLEDLAGRLFQTRALFHRIIDGETTLDAYLHEVFQQRGELFYALEEYRLKGLPEGVTPADYLESSEKGGVEKEECVRSGKMVFALERLLRLRGIRYVGFIDLANLLLEVPLKYIYRRRKFSSIGYATFEKEIYEALRVYNTLQNLAEEIRHFVLNHLVDDRVRIFGYEKVSSYLSYDNQIKLLFLALLGTRRFKKDGRPVSLNFLGMSEIIEKRYEAVNDNLNTLSTDDIWENKYQQNQLFKAKTGVILRRDLFPNVLTVDFKHRMDISPKISYMSTISNVEQLRNYFHYSLRSMRKHPFYTDDYEKQLENAFEKRLIEITDRILDQTKKQMAFIHDSEELHKLVSDLNERSLAIGFTDDQKHRLNDLYELRKDSLKREKLSEIDNVLETIHDVHELKDYWDSLKWYLQHNRRFFGKEFENLIAKKLDRVEKSTKDR